MGSLPCRSVLRLYGTTFRPPRTLQPIDQLRRFLHELLGHGHSSRSLCCYDVSILQDHTCERHC